MNQLAIVSDRGQGIILGLKIKPHTAEHLHRVDFALPDRGVSITAHHSTKKHRDPKTAALSDNRNLLSSVTRAQRL